MLYGKTKQHEFDSEFESEFECEGNYECEEDEIEQFFGGPIQGISSLLRGVGEGENDNQNKYDSEAFCTKIRGLARQLAPMLKQIAPIAAKVVGVTIAGKLASDSEYEFEGEFESEYECEAAPQPEALAEALAAMASHVESSAEAETYTGALTARIIPITSHSMRQISPKLIKGAAALTRILRQSPATRPLVKTVPTIVARTSNILAQRAAQEKAITPETAARVMAAETRKVLGNPMTCAKTLMRSSDAASKVIAEGRKKKEEGRRKM
jgi:hypothetical protein